MDPGSGKKGPGRYRLMGVERNGPPLTVRTHAGTMDIAWSPPKRVPVATIDWKLLPF